MQTIRTVRLAALGAALLVGGSTLAAQPPATAPGQQGEVTRGDRRADRRADGARQRGPRGPRAARRDLAGRSLFRGITLTEAQRTQVRAIRRKYAEQQRALVQDLRAKAGVAPGQRPDSAARAQLRARLQTEGRATMERQVAELRNVLTAEQRATFDRNLATARERMQARAERTRERGARRGEGRVEGRRGARGDA